MINTKKKSLKRDLDFWSKNTKKRATIAWGQYHYRATILFYSQIFKKVSKFGKNKICNFLTKIKKKILKNQKIMIFRNSKKQEKKKMRLKAAAFMFYKKSWKRKNNISLVSMRGACTDFSGGLDRSRGCGEQKKPKIKAIYSMNK